MNDTDLSNSIADLDLSGYVLKQKLIWRSTRRAMLEVDMYFSQFINQVGLDGLSREELTAYAALVECDDGDLMILFQGKDQVQNADAQRMVDKIRACSRI